MIASLDAASVGSTLVHAAQRWLHAVHEALATLEVTYSQVRLLSGIDDLSAEGTPITQVRLCAHTDTDVMATSKALRVLESRGLVERRAHPSDTRARALALTKQGSATLRKAMRVIAKVDRAFMAEHATADRMHKTLLTIAGGT